MLLLTLIKHKFYEYSRKIVLVEGGVKMVIYKWVLFPVKTEQ